MSKKMTNWPFHAIPPQRVPFQALNAHASGSYSTAERPHVEGFDLDLDFDRGALSAETRAIHRDVAAVSFRSLPD
jgi:hypothetical protein